MKFEFRYRHGPVLAIALSVAMLGAAAAGAADRYESTYAQMDAAATRYREAQLRLARGDDTAAAAMTTALEDVEDLARGCMKQKRCNSARVITVYEGMLRGHDFGNTEPMLVGENHADPDHASPILAASPQARQALSQLPDGHQFDAMVEFNEPVQAAMRDWLTHRRAFLIDAHENYQYMRYLMYPEYQRSGLPEALLFGIMAQESGGKVHSVSRSGASGPLQFMPATGYRFGLGRDGSGFDTRFDPQFAARANAAYINERFAELNRNLEYTVAAYNGGEGRALRLFQQSGGRPFWSPEVYSQLPPETRDYVPMVIAAAWLYLHPAEYGLTFPKIDAKPASLRLAQPSSIYQLTICLGNRGEREGYMRALRNLNPRYQAESWLPTGTTLNATTKIVGLYNRWCTSGARADLARTLVLSDPATAIVRNVPASTAMAVASATDEAEAKASASGRAKAEKARNTKPKRPTAYRVQRGETLTAIAQKFQCDTGDLAKTNKIKGPRFAIRPGQKLKLDGCGG